jgi:hypothetical protein
MAQLDEHELLQLFEKWYIVPLRELQNMPDNNAVLLPSCALFLYERYLNVKLSPAGTVTKERKHKQIAHDFGISEAIAEKFWGVMRDGLLHQGMPMQMAHDKEMPKWEFNFSENGHPIELDSGNLVLRVQPWEVVDRVILLWQKDIHLFNQAKSFPIPGIFVKPSDETGELYIITGTSSGLQELI